MSTGIQNQNNQGEKYAKILLKTILLVFVFTGGFAFGYRMKDFANQRYISGYQSRMNSGIVEKKSGMDIFYEVWDEVEEGYIEREIDNEVLVYGGIRGVVESLGDKYTTFFDPEETKEMSNRNGSIFEGIGTTLRYEGEYTIIETPIAGFPAEASGLMPKDIILEVNDEDMRRKRAHFVAEKIMGEAGTEVKLKVFRENDGQVYEKTIVRQVIDMANIDYTDLGDGIFQIKIHKFTESSVLEFKTKWSEIIEEITSNKVNGIILDLRSNPGGFVDAAIYVLEEFFDKGTLILSEVDRDGNEVNRTTKRSGGLSDIKVVVLVNSGSASASEIVAGAFQDHERAILVGEETVGKGVEQKVVSLSDGSSLHLVYKKWLTPDGHNVSYENPIVPNEVVEYTTEDFEQSRDPQLDRALELLR